MQTELFHYTGIHGLKGIIESQTLWASHYKFLNDAEEVVHLRARLPEELELRFRKLIADLDSSQKEPLLNRYGSVEKAITAEVEHLMKFMYELLITSEPFITSFCKASDPYVAEHGLLSQWRGYGSRGGYALVFGMDGLKKLLNQETAKYPGTFLAFAKDVVYDSAVGTLASFQKQVDELATKWIQMKYLPNVLPRLADTITNFVDCASRYKHRAFSEENEFRIVCIPIPLSKHPTKPLKTFLRKNRVVPYLNLFEGITSATDKPLPINRIIVGPGEDREKRQIGVDRLCKQHGLKGVDVTVSEIPYVE